MSWRALAARVLAGAAVLAALATLGVGVGPGDHTAHAQGQTVTFHVNITVDEPDADLTDGRCDYDPDTEGDQCSLRAAIMEANAQAGPNKEFIINLQGETYSLPAPSSDSDTDQADRDDLDVRAKVTVAGPEAGLAVIQLATPPWTCMRLFEVWPGAELTLHNLRVKDFCTPEGAASINSDDGGAVYVHADAALTVQGVTFTGNWADDEGGAIYNAGTLSVRQSFFGPVEEGELRNIAGYTGGAIYNAGTAAVEDSQFVYNHADYYGGAIFNDEGGILTVTGSTFSDNSASYEGGAIKNDSDGIVTIDDSQFDGNWADDGGAIYNYGILHVSRSTFVGNEADDWSDDGDGGAIYDSGDGTVIQTSTFTSNSASGDGGAISGDSDTLILRSTFTYNRAEGWGGAVDGGLIVNSTFFRNIAEVGAAVADADVLFSTVAKNGDWFDTESGGGVAYATVRNSIVAENIPDNCDSDSVYDEGGNISDDDSCEEFTQVDDAGLADAVAEDGTLHLEDGSPAIDAVAVDECTDFEDRPVPTDQRGILRPQPSNGQCDAGAYEKDQGAAPVLHTLTVSVGDSAVGTVRSSPAGLACPSTCSNQFETGTVVALVATPASLFLSWSGDCSGTSPFTTVTIDGDKMCSARFTSQPTLTVQLQGSGQGTVASEDGGINCPADCEEGYDVGTQVTLSATAAEGSLFVGWDGACSGTDHTVVVIMNANKTCIARFELARTLTVQVSGDGTVTSNPGGISCPPTCNATFPDGTPVTLVAEAGDHVFTGWSGACSGTSSTTTVMMDANKTCTATFEPAQVLFSEDFSDGIPSTWQVEDGGSGGGNAATWTTANPCNLSIGSPFTAPFAMVDSDCAEEDATQDESLITPEIPAADCLGSNGRILLEFANQFRWWEEGDDEKGDVDVSIDGGATWANVLRMQGGDDGYPTPNVKSLDLTSSLAGASSFRIRFHYYDGNYDYWWAIDNVRVLCVGVTGGGGGGGGGAGDGGGAGGGGGAGDGGPTPPPEQPPPPPREETVSSPTGSGQLTFQVGEGTSFTNFDVQPFGGEPPAPVPAGYELPHGLYSLVVGGLTPGASVTIQVTLPAPAPVGTVWLKLVGGSWVALPVGSDDGDALITLTLTDGGTGDADGAANGVITDPGGPAFPRPQQQPSQAPSAPSLVSLWPCGQGLACISFQPPQGATSYRLESALNPEFTFGLNEVQVQASSLLFGNTIVVGMPDAEGLAFHYRLSACNEAGCSAAVAAGAMAARRFPAGTSEHWALVVGGYRFLGTTYAWAQSQVTVPGKLSDLHLYDGVQGYGGRRVHSCQGVAPGGTCSFSWAGGEAWLSGSQEFPPYGEVGVAIRLP
ncbi:MAG TPA: choice-of-anchor U domain-containing protein [Dehalococcoidia bacterium]|nr:choice-of-anchor U domain-containing protein [Dehalococcoidia bacterium]